MGVVSIQAAHVPLEYRIRLVDATHRKRRVVALCFSSKVDAIMHLVMRVAAHYPHGGKAGALEIIIHPEHGRAVVVLPIGAAQIRRLTIVVSVEKIHGQWGESHIDTYAVVSRYWILYPEPVQRLRARVTVVAFQPRWHNGAV